MRIVRIPPKRTLITAMGSVATIGSFDGGHLAHQAIMQRVVTGAKRIGSESIVISFEPSPKEFFSQCRTTRILPFRDKAQFIAKQNISVFACLCFNQKLAKLTPAAFVQEILVDAFRVRHLVIGDDFALGRNREGTGSVLTALGVQHGFTVEQIATETHRKKRISSHWLKETLAEGDLELAKKLLGRPYAISGRVGHGTKRGKSLGVATANLDLPRCTLPLHGIFISKTQLPNGDVHPSVTYIGKCTFFAGKTIVVENHLIDFNADMYGKRIKIIFLKKIRDDQNFVSVEALKAQIKKDIAIAKDYRLTLSSAHE